MKQSVKRLVALLCCVLLLIPCINAMAQDEKMPVTVFVDGKQIAFDVEPIIEYGRVLVPMRFIFEALGADVTWDGETSTAIGNKDGISVAIQIGNSKMLVNNEAVELDVPAMLVDGRTLVPVRAISESFKAKVEWDGELRRVNITSESKKTDIPVEMQETESTPNVKDEYNLDELSPSDKELLLSMYKEIRYAFEQKTLYESLNSSPAEVYAALEAQYVRLGDVVNEIWDTLLMRVILDIQLNSEDTYVVSDIAEDENTLKIAYEKILKENGLDSSSVFKTSFAKTPAGKSVLLVSFNSVDYSDASNIQCVHIGVVPDGGSIRYFTVEASPLASEISGKPTVFLCEITSDSRSNYETTDADEDAFLAGIDKVIGSK